MGGKRHTTAKSKVDTRKLKRQPFFAAPCSLELIKYENGYFSPAIGCLCCWCPSAKSDENILRTKEAKNAAMFYAINPFRDGNSWQWLNSHDTPDTPQRFNLFSLRASRIIFLITNPTQIVDSAEHACINKDFQSNASARFKKSLASPKAHSRNTCRRQNGIRDNKLKAIRCVSLFYWRHGDCLESLTSSCELQIAVEEILLKVMKSSINIKYGEMTREEVRGVWKNLKSFVKLDGKKLLKKIF